MYAQEARQYITKLIRIQRTLDKKGYLRVDQPVVRQNINHLSKYLNYYRYETDEKMHGFFIRNRERIRLLIPNPTYPGYTKLLNEFYMLQNQQV